MIKNNIKIAWRTLKKNRFFSVINIAGLTIGITSFLLIALYIFDELTFDGFHKGADRIYRLVDNRTSPKGKVTKVAGAGYQLTARAKSDLPGIENVARLTGFGRTNVGANESKTVFYEDFIIASAGFLEVFDFPVLYGNRQTAFNAPNSVVVTEQTAKKLFGQTNVQGKILTLDKDTTPYKITAVLADFPVNSSISFNLAFSESSINNDRFKTFLSTDWSSDNFGSFLLVNKSVNVENLARRLNDLIASNYKSTDGSTNKIQLQPLKAVHFYSDDIEGPTTKGSIRYIYVFSAIAFFILLIACINYMNLATARYAGRSKEIAVRKVAGATRGNLTLQFLTEAFLVCIIALVLAVSLTKMLLPAFNQFTQKHLDLSLGSDPRIWTGIALVVVTVGLISGLYPALFQSGPKPLSLLKNNVHTGKWNISLRRSLVVFQFTLSIVMIIATIVVYQQMKYLNHKDMGFDKNQLVVVDINSGKVRRGAETIKAEFEKLPQIASVSATSRVPGEWKNLLRVQVNQEAAASPSVADMYFVGVDDKFLSTYTISLLAGRNFLSEGNADSSSVLINEVAAKALGITNPGGQAINIPAVNFGGDFSSLDKPFLARVIGIVKDFNFQSLHDPLAPMILGFKSNPIQSIDYFTARLKPGETATTLKQMDAILHGIDQDHLFEYHFLDKQWEIFYKEDRIRQTIFFSIALLAIVIACMGLFGLATYAAELRIKEIGIRKVLGASVSHIVTMLSKDFLKLVCIAALLAIPIAWYSMQQWLKDFAYRVNLSWWIFIVAALIAFLIALFTVSFQAIKSAVANPVKSIRTE